MEFSRIRIIKPVVILDKVLVEGKTLGYMVAVAQYWHMKLMIIIIIIEQTVLFEVLKKANRIIIANFNSGNVVKAICPPWKFEKDPNVLQLQGRPC